MVIRRQTRFERSSRKTCGLTGCGRFRGRTEIDSRDSDSDAYRGNPVWQEGAGKGGELLGAGGVEESVEQLVVPACGPLDILEPRKAFQARQRDLRFRRDQVEWKLRNQSLPGVWRRRQDGGPRGSLCSAGAQGQGARRRAQGRGLTVLLLKNKSRKSDEVKSLPLPFAALSPPWK